MHFLYSNSSSLKNEGQETNICQTYTFRFMFRFYSFFSVVRKIYNLGCGYHCCSSDQDPENWCINVDFPRVQLLDERTTKPPLLFNMPVPRRKNREEWLMLMVCSRSLGIQNWLSWSCSWFGKRKKKVKNLAPPKKNQGKWCINYKHQVPRRVLYIYIPGPSKGCQMVLRGVN